MWTNDHCTHIHVHTMCMCMLGAPFDACAGMFDCPSICPVMACQTNRNPRFARCFPARKILAIVNTTNLRGCVASTKPVRWLRLGDRWRMFPWMGWEGRPWAREVETWGTCSRGQNCSFAHSELQIRSLACDCQMPTAIGRVWNRVIPPKWHF